MAADTMEIIVGTYEEMLVGYKFTENDNKFSLTQSFTNHSHMGSVRCVCANSKFLATGSTDESINLFNLKTRTECGALVHHEGSINSLKFYGNSYLLSGSEDGNICVWQTSNWQCLKTLRGHKKGVTSLSVHPSGKIALSLSKDATLRTWNLIKGRSAYITNIKTVASLVEWSLSGSFYAVVVGEKVDVYSVEKAGIVHSIDYGKNVHCLVFLNDDVILIAGEGGTVEMHSTLKDKLYCQFETRSPRIKEMKLTEKTKKGENWRYLVTASNDGSIKIWELNVDDLENTKPNLIAQTNTGCRITCLTVSISNEKVKKEKNEVNEVEIIKEETENDVFVEETAKPGEKRQKQTTKPRKKKKIVHK